MQDRLQHIENTKRYVGWAYTDLKWFTEDEAASANDARDRLLASLPPSLTRTGCAGSKIYSGDMSRGCVTCSEGKWSCLMLNSRCTAKCFFCPQERAVGDEKPPTAGGITFEDPIEYADYLERFGIEGVGISGGEPLLALDQLLSFVSEIKKRFGDGMYIWLYTNGDLVDETKLERLKDAGLDEIRFDIVHRDYSLQSVELACRHLKRVTVEVPAIPEDYEKMTHCIRRMQGIGVSHLNLHQLHATTHNYKNLAERDYTFLHYPSNYPVPVFESEMTALELLRHALESRVDLPINYCSHIYKYRYQNGGARRRAATFGQCGVEDVTEAGFIRRLTLRGPSRSMGRVARRLRSAGCDEDLYALNESKTELTIHPSLLGHVSDSVSCEFVLRYFDVRVNTQGQYRIQLESGRSLFIERQLVAVKQMSRAEYGESRRPHFAGEAAALEGLGEGLAEVF